MPLHFEPIASFTKIRAGLIKVGFKCDNIIEKQQAENKHMQKDPKTNEWIPVPDIFLSTCNLDLQKVPNGVSIELKRKSDHTFDLNFHMQNAGGGKISLINMIGITMSNPSFTIPEFSLNTSDVYYEKQNAMLVAKLEQNSTSPYQVYPEYKHDPITLVFDIKK